MEQIYEERDGITYSSAFHSDAPGELWEHLVDAGAVEAMLDRVHKRVNVPYFDLQHPRGAIRLKYDYSPENGGEGFYSADIYNETLTESRKIGNLRFRLDDGVEILDEELGDYPYFTGGSPFDR